MKRLRTFQSSTKEVDGAVSRVLALLKAHTPTQVLEEALQGGKFYANREDEEMFPDLQKELFDYDPYLKRSTMESALDMWDRATKGKLSSSEKNRGVWIRCQGWFLKDLVMRQMKTEHNKRRYSSHRPRGSNMAAVVDVLMGAGSSRDNLQPPMSSAPTTPSEGWAGKHRRLLRRRSSEQDEVALVAYQKVSKPTLSSTSTKEEILALYGVRNVREDREPTAPSPKGKAKATFVDLTLEVSSPENSKENAKGRFKHYFDHHRSKVVRAWEDGSMDEAVTEQGTEGFVVGTFEDGTTWTSEVPNVAFDVSAGTFFSKTKKGSKTQPMKKQPMKKKKKKATNKVAEKTISEKKGKAKDKTKGKAKGKTKKKDQEEGSPTPEAAQEGAAPPEEGATGAEQRHDEDPQTKTLQCRVHALAHVSGDKQQASMFT